MAQISYPHITLNSTTQSPFVLTPAYNGVVITSTLGSSVILTVPAELPADFKCYAVQLGAGTIGVVAGTGAAATNVGGFSGTSGVGATMRILGYEDGHVTFTGDCA